MFKMMRINLRFLILIYSLFINIYLIFFIMRIEILDKNH